MPIFTTPKLSPVIIWPGFVWVSVREREGCSGTAPGAEVLGFNAWTCDRGGERVPQSSGHRGKRNEAERFLKLILHIIVDNISSHDDDYNLEVLYLYFMITLDLIRHCARQKSFSLEFLEMLNYMVIWLTYVTDPPPPPKKKLYTSYKQKKKEPRHSLWPGQDGRRGILWFNSNQSSRHAVTEPLQIYNQPWKIIYDMKFNFQFQLLFLPA